MVGINQNKYARQSKKTPFNRNPTIPINPAQFLLQKIVMHKKQNSQNMNPIIKTSIFAFCVLFFWSCSKKTGTTTTTITGDYLIVGHTGGFVMGTAINPYYLVHDTTLSADTSLNVTNIPTTTSGFHFNYHYPRARFDTVGAGLITSIPTELFSRNGASIGQMIPDVGYTDVRVSVGGNYYTWTFLPKQDSSSPAIQQFVIKLGKVMSN